MADTHIEALEDLRKEIGTAGEGGRWSRSIFDSILNVLFLLHERLAIAACSGQLRAALDASLKNNS